jgi:hypothetical protein
LLTTSPFDGAVCCHCHGSPLIWVKSWSTSNFAVVLVIAAMARRLSA